MVYFTGLTSVDYQSDLGALLVLHKVMVNTAAYNEGGEEDPICANRPIWQNGYLDPSSIACNDTLQARSRANL